MEWWVLRPSFQSCYRSVPPWVTWTGLFISLSLSFLICEMGTDYSASRVVEKIQETVSEDLLRTLGAC